MESSEQLEPAVSLRIGGIRSGPWHQLPLGTTGHWIESRDQGTRLGARTHRNRDRGFTGSTDLCGLVPTGGG